MDATNVSDVGIQFLLDVFIQNKRCARRGGEHENAEKRVCLNCVAKTNDVVMPTVAVWYEKGDQTLDAEAVKKAGIDSTQRIIR